MAITEASYTAVAVKMKTWLMAKSNPPMPPEALSDAEEFYKEMAKAIMEQIKLDSLVITVTPGVQAGSATLPGTGTLT